MDFFHFEILVLNQSDGTLTSNIVNGFCFLSQVTQHTHVTIIMLIAWLIIQLLYLCLCVFVCVCVCVCVCVVSCLRLLTLLLLLLITVTTVAHASIMVHPEIIQKRWFNTDKKECKPTAYFCNILKIFQIISLSCYEFWSFITEGQGHDWRQWHTLGIELFAESLPIADQ